MKKRETMFYSALLLTGANLLLRVSSLGFQVYLSGRIGASGIGLLQLALSVSTLAMTAGMGGIRTATMYLTAARIGRNRGGTGRVLSCCMGYSLLCSLSVAALVWLLGPWLAGTWIGDTRTLPAVRIFGVFLPVVCMVGVLTGYFTAAGRVRELVAVEIAEQVVSMGATVLLLQRFPGADAGKSCAIVVLGSSTGSLVTLGALLFLKGKLRGDRSREPVIPDLLKTAVPLALADDLRMGISTAENLIVPRRLRLFAGTSNALADYGQVCGMVFPVLMFPACILYSLAELLIPELSRCAAGGRLRRVRYLTNRSLRVAMLYGLAAGGVLFTAAEPLGILLYGDVHVGRLLKTFSVLVPMLYADAVVDATVKGMGQQVACVRYNTLTSFLDVVFLWVLLPVLGLKGYYLSFAATHLLNFILSVRRLRKVTGFEADPWALVKTVLCAVTCCLFLSRLPLPGVLLPACGYLAAFFLLTTLTGCTGREDLRWLRGLARGA